MDLSEDQQLQQAIKNSLETEKKKDEKMSQMTEKQRDDLFIKLCSENKCDEIAKMIIDQTSDIDEDFPLACEHGTANIVQLYLDKGAFPSPFAISKAKENTRHKDKILALLKR
ncbi:MAG: hypothetical protein Edafosvirus1_141 [Edafosvirus sp.]|uniref:Ankyrin repeat protein n=1 Tax=Edafosvirus sp. TaxID=2487765 RepID=A0A3G4ZSD4_9VIRU|nr:MAG: hypothetical protein Edafosvirus1_141 [Edafosvirus sp.]